MNQSLVDEIVSNVLAQLQPSVARSVPKLEIPKPVENAKPIEKPAMSPAAPTVIELKVVELTTAVITADMLAAVAQPGQAFRFGRKSILTPSARDWLQAKRIAWSRQERTAGGKESGGKCPRWRIILQTVTPTVKALQEGLRRTSDSWKIELVGQPQEAATLATTLICTAESDGVVIFTEQADLVACHANRNERVRAAVMQNSKQWELVMKSLSANVVCINPIGRTFVELRNLLMDCAKN